jgi:hypothetical protein
LAHSIQRIKVKGTGVRARSNPDQEPDFWSMPWVQPQQSFQDCDYNDSAPETVSCESSEFSGRSSSTASPQHFSLQFQPEDTQSALFQSSNSALPAAFFSHKLPLHMEPAALPLQNASAQLDDDELFGKHFFDVEKIGQMPAAVRASPLPAVPTTLFENLDDESDLLSKEVDEFFEDFDFPDDIGNEIEDDEIFGALLEQMIS